MKVKTSITLSSDLLGEIDRLSDGEPRSAFIEDVLRSFVQLRARMEADALDLERINAAADRLNSEAADVLRHQAPIEG